MHPGRRSRLLNGCTWGTEYLWCRAVPEVLSTTQAESHVTILDAPTDRHPSSIEGEPDQAVRYFGGMQ